MKKIKQYSAPLICFAFLAVATIAASFTEGCATKLDPAGVYGSQTNGMVLYQADLTITTAYNEFDAFLSWETANHAWLVTNAPQVVAAANSIRVNAPKWIASAVALRQSYAANATAENATALNTALSVITTAVSQAQTYMATAIPKS